jgi:hypothetical protein
MILPLANLLSAATANAVRVIDIFAVSNLSTDGILPQPSSSIIQSIFFGVDESLYFDDFF